MREVGDARQARAAHETSSELDGIGPVRLDGMLRGGGALRPAAVARMAAVAGNRATVRAVHARRPMAVDSSHEREADDVASAVTRSIRDPEPQPIAAPIRTIAGVGDGLGLAQLKSELGEAPARALGDQLRGARTGGQPLERDLASRLGQAMRADLSDVRVHVDDRADRMNRALRSRAFTSGHDVFFRGGHYRPRSPAGQELLAHELTHVVQQGGVDRGLVQRKIGFEFQTVGESNPKVLKCADDLPGFDFAKHKEPILNAYPEVLDSLTDDDGNGQSAMIWAYPWRDHGKDLGFENPPCKFEVDKGDVEIVTDAFDESPEGRAKMLTQVGQLIAFLIGLYNKRESYYVHIHTLRKAKRNAPSVDSRQPRWDFKSKSLDARDLTVAGGQAHRGDPGWTAIWWPRTNNAPRAYQAAIQSTLGIRFDAVADLVQAQIDSSTMANKPRYPSFENQQVYLGSKVMNDNVYSAEADRVNATVSRWLTANVTDPEESALLGGLLRAIGLRFAIGTTAIAEERTMSYSKDYLMIMNRTTLHEIVKKLAGTRKTENLDRAFGDPAAVFGRKYTAETAWLPKAHTTVGDYLRAVRDGGSEAGVTHDAAIGIIDSSSTEELRRFGMSDPADIGRGYAEEDEQRKGLVVELRQLSASGERPPVEEWVNVCDALFRAMVYLNSGKQTALDATETETPRIDIRHVASKPAPRPREHPRARPLPTLPPPLHAPSSAPTQSVTQAPLPGPAPLPRASSGVAPLPAFFRSGDTLTSLSNQQPSQSQPSVPDPLADRTPPPPSTATAPMPTMFRDGDTLVPYQQPSAPRTQPAQSQQPVPQDMSAQPQDPQPTLVRQRPIDRGRDPAFVAATRLVRSLIPQHIFRDATKRQTFLAEWTTRVLDGEFGSTLALTDLRYNELRFRALKNKLARAITDEAS